MATINTPTPVVRRPAIDPIASVRPAGKILRVIKRMQESARQAERAG